MQARPIIAILEDDANNRDRLADLVTASGFDPLLVVPKAPALNDLQSYLDNKQVEMIVCDHRLFEKGAYANYTGAAAVAANYQAKRGGVLITAYENRDAEDSIRRFRRWIPELIHATELSKTALTLALSRAQEEVLRQRLAPQRIPYRTIMTVTDMVGRTAAPIVRVVMAQWDPGVEVGFPLSMMPEVLHSSV